MKDITLWAWLFTKMENRPKIPQKPVIYGLFYLILVANPHLLNFQTLPCLSILTKYALRFIIFQTQPKYLHEITMIPPAFSISRWVLITTNIYSVVSKYLLNQACLHPLGLGY